MTPAFVQGLAMDTMKLILIISAPALLTALIVGLTISVIQATTQINEMTLTYIPKMVAIYTSLIIFGGFILDRIMNFSIGIFSDFTRFTQ